jgi:tetratricopeptide (TPR) repeat protein
MGQNIDQILQNGITAHKEGKLQEAEQIYRSILKSQPSHSDANHNLGVLSVSTNNSDAAILFFKTAVKSNPNVEQFWFSFINALINENRFQEAEKYLVECKEIFKDSENIDTLREHLITASIIKSPSQLELENLLKHYQSKKYISAEKLALSIIKKFPKHQFSWKILGALLSQTGRQSEALIAEKKATELNPQDPQSHYNLGITLRDIGRLEESESSFRKAILLKNNYAEAIINLGIILQKMNRFEEAAAIYNQTIAMNFKNFKAHNNLGNTLRKMHKLVDSVASYKVAITLKSDFQEAHYNLGAALQELGKLEEAEVSMRKSIALNNDYAEAMLGLATLLDYMNNSDAAIHILKNLIKIDANHYGLRARVRLALFAFLEDNLLETKAHLIASSKILEKSSIEFKNAKIYHEYLTNILNQEKSKDLDIKNIKDNKRIYVIGESHSLVSHNNYIKKSDNYFLCKSFLILGCKQWHLGNPIRNQYKEKFERIIRSLTKSSQVLITIGEIDCRLDSGIIKYQRKFPEKNIEDIIGSTIDNYIDYIFKINDSYQHKIVIQGIPCPNVDVKTIPENQITHLIKIISIFNSKLKNKSKEKRFGFLDVHRLTDRGDGFSNNTWHVDDHHLSNEAIKEAWQSHFIY